MSTDPKALARSLRRRYRRSLPELSKILKGKTPSQAKTKANIEKYGLDVIERYFTVQAKDAAKAVKKENKKLKGPQPIKLPKKLVVVKAKPIKKGEAEALKAIEAQA